MIRNHLQKKLSVCFRGLVVLVTAGAHEQFVNGIIALSGLISSNFSGYLAVEEVAQLIFP